MVWVAPYLIKLLETGAILHIKTGRHRKVRASELFAYKQKRDETRSAALSDLAVLDADLLCPIMSVRAAPNTPLTEL